MQKKKNLLLAFYILTLIQNNYSQSFTWVKQMKTASSTAISYGVSIATDASGNVYTIGDFNGTVDFDPGSGISNLNSNSQDVFISKLDAGGNFMWAKKFGGSNIDYGASICVDIFGNVYTIGDFTGTVDFDPGTGVFNLTSSNSSDDVFISKLDAGGNFVWAKKIGGSSLDRGYSIFVDAIGNIYTTGTFSGIVDFDPGPGIVNSTSNAGEDIFISKLDASGNFIWVKTIGGAANDVPSSVTVDSNGNVYTTGYFSCSVDFDPSNGIFNLTTGCNNNGFISKLDASGNFVWAKQFVGNNTFVDDIAIDLNDNIYTVGHFYSSLIDMDPGPNTYSFSTAGSQDLFISKLNASGNFVWANRIGGTGLEASGSIALDATSNVYVSGVFASIVDFDPGVATFTLSATNGNAFISKFNASGFFSSVKQIGGAGFTTINDISLDGSYNIYTTGEFSQTADFDPGIGTFTLTSGSGGVGDIFIHKMSSNTTYIQDSYSDNPVVVYPNPTNNELRIVFKEPITKIDVIIRNYLGLEIFRKSYNHVNNIELIMEGQDSGLYFLEIEENGKKMTTKIVKN